MSEVAGEQHIAGLRQLHHQAVMTGRMAGRVQHQHGAVAKHILVQSQRLDLALAFDPVREWLWVHTRRGLRTGQRIPITLADQERRLRERADLTDVVAMIVADADILDLIGLYVDLPQEVHQAHLRGDCTGTHRVAGTCRLTTTKGCAADRIGADRPQQPSGSR